METELMMVIGAIYAAIVFIAFWWDNHLEKKALLEAGWTLEELKGKVAK